jgi:hypothetical protein
MTMNAIFELNQRLKAGPLNGDAQEVGDVPFKYGANKADHLARSNVANAASAQTRAGPDDVCGDASV